MRPVRLGGRPTGGGRTALVRELSHAQRPVGDLVNLNKSTRYALHSMLDLTQAGGKPVTVAQVASRWDISETALAKVLQQLVRAGFIHGVRGIGGGYKLARPASEVTVQDVIDAFEPTQSGGGCQLKDILDAACPTEEPSCRLRELFDEVDETVRSTFRSVTFDTLAR